jgi:hypothetical protein
MKSAEEFAVEELHSTSGLVREVFGSNRASPDFHPLRRREDFQPRITRITRMGAITLYSRPYEEIARPSASFA